MAMVMDPAFSPGCVFYPMQPDMRSYWGCMQTGHMYVPAECGDFPGFAAQTFAGTSVASAASPNGRIRSSRGANRRQAIPNSKKESQKRPSALTPLVQTQQPTPKARSSDVDSSDSWEALKSSKPVGSRRWADIDSDDDGDQDIDAELTEGAPLTGRAAKRQRQRLRRRLGRAESAADRVQARSVVDDASTSSGATSTCPSEPSVDEAQSISAHSSKDDAAEKALRKGTSPSLPELSFAATPEFEQYRLAYRSFRLGNAVGAKGEVSDAGNPNMSQRDANPMLTVWSVFLRSLNLFVAHA